MSLIDIILGRKNIYKLRKEYDKLREKADKYPDISTRMTILHFLDKIESQIVNLEEGIIPDFQRRRTINYIDNELKKAKRMVSKKDYMQPMMGPQGKKPAARH